MKFCKKVFVSFALINIFFSIHSVAQTTDDLEQMIRSSKTRAALVQNVQKAVVHIKVEKIVRGSDGRFFNTFKVITTHVEMVKTSNNTTRIT